MTYIIAKLATPIGIALGAAYLFDHYANQVAFWLRSIGP